jgi:hypothetical protein
MMKAPSYLGGFWRSRTNRWAMFGAAGLALFASIPFGWTGFAIVAVVALGAEILAALMVPDMPSFRAWLDREHHAKERERRRASLLAELRSYGDAGALASYAQMLDRVKALQQTAADSRTSLTGQDVDKLDDLTVDYLGLCVLNLSLKQRKDNANEEMAIKRMTAIQQQLQRKDLTEEEGRQLRNALAEYGEIVSRSRRLASRRFALEAMLIAMPDKVEEVYQLVMTSPYSSDTGGKLEESLSRLRLAEEVAAEFGDAEAVLEQPRKALGASALSGADLAVRRAARAVKA